MKKLFLILGGVVCIGLIITAMYVGLTIGLSYYLASEYKSRAMTYHNHAREAEIAQMKQSIMALGKNTDAGQKRDEAELAGKLPSLFVDPDGYKIEDNWLATMISREIVEMALVAAHPEQPLPDLHVRAQVNLDQPAVHVEINGLAGTAVTSDLTPAFAWDPSGYAPLAKQILGGTVAPAPAAESENPDVLAHLLELTGAKLAAEDVRLSANLQQQPASWQNHEAAALVLVALALREGTTSYADNRLFLCRATAHLAIAQALRGEQPATWPGLIADAAVRTLSGREVDALAHLDSVSMQPNVPVAATTWITALRMRAKQDWRVADVTEKSPLLLKIVWFGVVLTDLENEVATDRLKKVVPAPAIDPNTSPDTGVKPNPESLLPDWGRIAGRNPLSGYDAADPKAAEFDIDLELHELDTVLQAEGAGPLVLDNLATVVSEGETDTVSRDASGHNVTHVVGLGTFKADAVRHLLNDLPAKDALNETGQDPAQAQYEFAKLDKLFQGVPGYEMARRHLNFTEQTDDKPTYDKWIADKKSWPVWGVSFEMSYGMPGYALVKSFYAHAVPFGTAYELGRRWTFVIAMEPDVQPPFDTPELEKLKLLPPDEAIRAINTYRIKYNALLQSALLNRPAPPIVQELAKLDPDDLGVATFNVLRDGLLSRDRRFLDYNLNYIHQIENLDSDHLSNDDREMVLRKHAELQPLFYFELANILRGDGKADAAALADRKGVATMGDDSFSYIYSLLAYDEDHGNVDEALALTKRELGQGWADENTLSQRCDALEAAGRLDEAAAFAAKITDQYDDTSPRLLLYAEHPNHFKAQYDSELKRVFHGEGLKKIDLASLSGKPDEGMIFQDDSAGTTGMDWFYRMSHLQAGDVIVGLDGYKVDSAMQYFFIAGLSRNPTMDCLVWRDSTYQEVKAFVPHRRLPFTISELGFAGK